MLRSQDVRTKSDPTTLDGTIARIDPDTGNAPADNPLWASADAEHQPHRRDGFRNPFRITFRPGHGDVYVGDVGQNDVGSDRPSGPITAITPTTMPNVGWPCYEGSRGPGRVREPRHETCAPACTPRARMDAAVYTYSHKSTKLPKGPCFPGNADRPRRSGLAFYQGTGARSTTRASTTARCSSSTTPATASAILPRASGMPDASRSSRSRRRSTGRSTSRRGRAATCTTSTTTSAGSCGSSTPTRRSPGRPPIPRAASPRSPSTSTGPRRATPTPTSPSTAGTGTSTTTGASTPRVRRSTGRSTPPASTRSSSACTARAASPTRRRSRSTRPTTRRSR